MKTDCRLMVRPSILHIILAILFSQLPFIESATGTLFVYETPDGSRLITDRPMLGKEYRLIHSSKTPLHVGAIAAGRQVWAKRGNPAAFDGLIRKVAKLNRLDPALIKAIIHVESSFDPAAVSHKGAAGLMQLMPGTARRYGVENTFDPAQNIAGGSRYLKDLLETFNHNSRLALAAYNAGENAVKRYRGVPPYSETLNYIRKVTLLRNRYSAKYR